MIVLYFIFYIEISMKKIFTLIVLACATFALTGCTLFKKTDTTMTTDWAAVLDVVPASSAVVSVNYVGKLEDGTVFDTNIAEEAQAAGSFSEIRTYSPLTFTVGAGQMIPGFEQGVIGMKKWETKTLTIPAAEAYGEPKAELLFTTGATMFTDAGITPVIGESYNFGGAAGKVTALEWDQVTLDFNHELAGKTLIFTVTVVDVSSETATIPTAETQPIVEDTTAQ
jgi:FKBP-type peptidyl-prolyl cis-trans isomerase 2